MSLDQLAFDFGIYSWMESDAITATATLIKQLKIGYGSEFQAGYTL